MQRWLRPRFLRRFHAQSLRRNQQQQQQQQQQPPPPPPPTDPIFPIEPEIPAPPPSKPFSALLAQRAEEGYQVVHKYRRTITEVLLWMICGSLALELKSLRSDQQEYLKTIDAQHRKHLTRLKELQGAPKAEPVRETETPYPTPRTFSKEEPVNEKILIY
ncbi:hypothetical protein HDU96_000808 [Phlyctochytrium bullatum]|nr:hypothetical protein HDU96_000808 [Phlyctochytrium bullatum]